MLVQCLYLWTYLRLNVLDLQTCWPLVMLISSQFFIQIAICYSSYSFYLIRANKAVMGAYSLSYVLVICQKWQILWHLKFFSTQDHMQIWGWKFQNTTLHYYPYTFCLISSCSFNLILSKLYGAIAYNEGMQAITFLGNWPSFKIVWHFESLTWELIGKS